MKKLSEVLEKNIQGLCYGNRVLLPFSGEILKIVIGHEIITDFSRSRHGARIRVTEDFTEIYFCDYENLSQEIPKYQVIKIVMLEDEKNVFDFKDHISIELEIKEKHRLNIKLIGDDILFIE